MAQIQIENLSFSYAASQKTSPSICDISLEMNAGEFVVICGASGCGKSTLLRSLKPGIRPAGTIKGKVLYHGTPIDEVSKKVQATEIGFVMQNPEHQIVTDKVWHELAFGLENIGVKREDIRFRVAEVAEYFGITDLYFRSISELSGGQKQLINLAAAMAMHPEVMILDEPTSQLDPIAAETFMDLIKKVNEDLGVTIILSEHRLNMALPKADRMIVMEKGRILYNGLPIEALSVMEKKDIIKLMPVPTQVFKQCHGKGQVPMSVAQGRKWLGKCEIKSGNSFQNFMETSEKSETNENAISCRHVWFRYGKQEKDILQDLNVEIKKGEIFAILGGNGTGKTTTMSLLCGIYRPYRGKVKMNGKAALLPQDVQTLFLKDTVKEELKGVEPQIIRWLNLTDLLESHPYDLSGGEQQKVALAKILAVNPDILLLDEPTKGIDPIFKEQLGNYMTQLAGQGKTIVLVSHDVDFCGEFAHRCGLFANGKLIAINQSREFFCANRFYTTTVHKMAATRLKEAVRMEDIVCALK